MKIIKNILFITFPTLLVMIIILELFFRFVIPANNPPLNEYNSEDQFLRYSNQVPTGQYTIGKFAEIRSKWTINNYGFNYPIDFELSNARDSIPLIAIIGDSYIEAFQVDSDKNYPYLLRERIYPEFEVYGFGMSGAPLSHYYHMNKYINKHFDPDIVVFQVIHNDFDQSFKHKSHNSIWWQIEKEDSSYSFVSPSLSNFTPSITPYKSLLYHSAFFRYLHRNLLIFTIIRSGYHGEVRNVEANIKIINDKKHSDILHGIDFLFNKIKQENEDKRVIFIFDAPRNTIYEGKLKMSQVMWMHEMVSFLSSKYEFEYIDLTEPMQHDFAIYSKRFNSDIDGHWNEYGHKFVANILHQYLENNKH